ncbi:Uncharacterized protein FWK35_00021156 [Aphis craccivora]|uniref:Transposable element P transposase-like RNase H domain-containing protein n=1 Tax=Aphis craccivora TaxID=307492 RepID=A0A6G0YWW5_APHCR|nr:Uncharacterized protein FWK35_00021156 [Aphis craccivora]
MKEKSIYHVSLATKYSGRWNNEFTLMGPPYSTRICHTYLAFQSGGNIDEFARVEGLTNRTMAFKCTFITRRGPEHNGAANHALVFMLADISSRLKQTVAYYFTGDSVKEDTFKTIIIEIISKAEALGLKVNLVTSDMGACNKSMRKRFGIYCLSGNTRHTQNSTVHPYVPHLKFLDDVFDFSKTKFILTELSDQENELCDGFNDSTIIALQNTEQNCLYNIAASRCKNVGTLLTKNIKKSAACLKASKSIAMREAVQNKKKLSECAYDRTTEQNGDSKEVDGFAKQNSECLCAVGV